MTHLGALLRSYREDRGLSQEALAERAGAGLSVNTIRNIERGRTRPYQHTVEALCQALRLTEREQEEVLAAWTQTGVPAKGSTRSTLPGARHVPDSPHPANLPLLLGREREASEALRLVRGGVRLLTLTGPGGVGKTRLALHLAEQLASEGDVFFIPLATVNEPQLVPAVIAERLGIEDAGAAAPEELLIRALRDHRAVLLLDNIEQVADASPTIAQLLDHCPHLHILTTSRIPLHLRGEQELPVPPLPVPAAPERLSVEELTRYPAVGLFLQRARAVKPDFRPTAEQAVAVAEICRRLDGIPLAIELAAARVKMLAPTALLARLHLRLLAHGPRDLPARQQTMWDAIAWSYDLLDPNDQVLFRALSVFRGGCSLEAIAAVCPGEADVLDGVATLVDKSLLTADAGEEPRFRLLEPIREFALEQLEVQGEGATARRRHAQFFYALAEEAYPQISDPDGVHVRAWLERLERDHDNLRDALRWMLEAEETDAALRFAVALWAFWEPHGHVREGGRWLEAAAALAGKADPRLRASVQWAAGKAAYLRGDLDRAGAIATDCLGQYRILGDRHKVARSVLNLGLLLAERGRLDEAIGLHQEALALMHELGERESIAGTLANLGWLWHEQGNVERAAEALDEALARARELGSPRAVIWPLMEAGRLARDQGAFGEAAEHVREGIKVARELGDLGGMVAFLGETAVLAAAEGNLPRAALFGSAETTLRGRYGIHLDPFNEDRRRRAMDRARRELDAETWHRASEEGQTMDLDEAISAALDGDVGEEPARAPRKGLRGSSDALTRRGA